MVKLSNFVNNLSSSISSFFKVLILSRVVSFKKVKRTSDSCVILGNGPSLNPFMENHLSFLEGKDTICVNLFGKTDPYKKIKPNHYIITAPQYWRGEKQKDYLESRADTLKSIRDNTDWDMTFFAPSFANKDKKWITDYKENKKISIQYFNTTPVEGFEWFTNTFFSANLGMPRPHNVLISAIYVAIQSGYKKIYLTGADHSWLPQITVSDENEVLAVQNHFYDKEFKDDKIHSAMPRPVTHNGEYQSKKMYQVLEKFYVTFKSHFELSKFAQYKKVSIINITPNSFIDVYPRKKLS